MVREHPDGGANVSPTAVPRRAAAVESLASRRLARGRCGRRGRCGGGIQAGLLDDDYAMVTNPAGVGGAFGDLLNLMNVLGGALLAVVLLLSVLSIVLRLRRSRGERRQQIKWIVYAGAVMVAAFLAGSLVPGGSNPMADLLWVVGFVAVVGIPVAAGIAILRHRLYDIDLLINRTLVYGSLTVLLVAAYVGGVVGLQSVFRATTGQESTLAVVASTLAIAALFGPLRRWVQASVDRHFYRRKYDAAKTLAAFNARLREETQLETLSGDVVGVARETMQPAHLSLWLRPNAEPEASNAAIEQFGH
jgi:type III secretory pathway component EscS